MFSFKLIGAFLFAIQSFLGLNILFYIPKCTVVYTRYIADVSDTCLDNTPKDVQLVQNVRNVIIQLLCVQAKNICP